MKIKKKNKDNKTSKWYIIKIIKYKYFKGIKY